MLVGGKIDAGATDQKATKQFVIPDAWADEDKKVNISPKAVMHSRDDDYSQEGYQPLVVDAEQAAATYDELQARILDSSGALGLEITTQDIEGDEEHITGIVLYDPEQEREVMRFDSYLFELEALTFLRWVVVEKRMTTEELRNATALHYFSSPK